MSGSDFVGPAPQSRPAKRGERKTARANRGLGDVEPDHDGGGPLVKLTYDDFVQFPDDGKRHELIDGEHCVTAAPNLKHQAVVVNLTGLLWTHLRVHAVGRVFAAPVDVVFSGSDAPHCCRSNRAMC